MQTGELIDRWIPDYAARGFDRYEAGVIAMACRAIQERQPEREWTEILSEVVERAIAAAGSIVEIGDVL